jgi:tRNA/tmRNA/rRNA uracil-C5-methylase (TrmA/RlmC/RlmD family)
MTYEHQLHWKSHQVGPGVTSRRKIPRTSSAPIVPSPREYEYRNRITIHVTDSVVGFFRHDTHRLIDVERCPIAMPEVNDELAALRARRPRDGNYTLRAGRGPRIFSQTNEAVAAHLSDVIAELIPSSHTTVIDAYCGAGFFAKRLVAGGNDSDVSGIKSRSGRARLQLVIESTGTFMASASRKRK